MKPAIPMNVRCAWHVLRSRPLIYRVTFDDGIVLKPHENLLINCLIDGSARAARLRKDRQSWRYRLAAWMFRKLVGRAVEEDRPGVRIPIHPDGRAEGGRE
jgi:hypothetical protein